MNKRLSLENNFDAKEFSYIMGCINNLRNQINALEFVLNEDTVLNDYTVPYPTQEDEGVSKEKVFKIIEDFDDLNDSGKLGGCTHKNKESFTIGGVTFTRVITCKDCGKILKQ